jgi:hypothetical protein
MRRSTFATVSAAVLLAGVTSRTATLSPTFEPIAGYLPALLQRLAVPVESQVAVFSSLSAQSKLVSAENPRVIYYADDVAVAWVRGSQTIEIAKTDPTHRLAFYTVRQDEHQEPALTSGEGCERCHQSAATLGVSGLITQGVVDGPIPQIRTTDHRTPLQQRWAGWYVTGRSSGWKHQGNRVGQGWLFSLYDQFYDDGYLGRYSDIVALMVLEHQARMTNLLNLLDAQIRNDAPAQSRAKTVSDVLDYMLFADEAPLPARIMGTSGFTEYFETLGPRDREGRSLRQFDLKTRLFKYPLSYMVYSNSFQHLPVTGKNAIYDGIISVLAADTERRPLLEILSDTQPEFQARLRRVRLPAGSSHRPETEGIRLSSSSGATRPD